MINCRLLVLTLALAGSSFAAVPMTIVVGRGELLQFANDVK
ncbi:MAG: hypothetical protein JWO80_259, partial [Bryobacterales bacterium]|nr:hypothetical protein [Bryobacterales bacterium]